MSQRVSKALQGLVMPLAICGAAAACGPKKKAATAPAASARVANASAVNAYSATIYVPTGAASALTDVTASLALQIVTFTAASGGTLASTTQPAVAVVGSGTGLATISVQVPVGAAASFLLMNGGQPTGLGAFLPAATGPGAPNVPVTANGGTLAKVVASVAGQAGAAMLIKAPLAPLLVLTHGIDAASLGSSGAGALGQQLISALSAMNQVLVSGGLSQGQIDQLNAAVNADLGKQEWNAQNIQPDMTQFKTEQSAALSAYGADAPALLSALNGNPAQALMQQMDFAALAPNVVAAERGAVGSVVGLGSLSASQPCCAAPSSATTATDAGAATVAATVTDSSASVGTATGSATDAAATGAGTASATDAGASVGTGTPSATSAGASIGTGTESNGGTRTYPPTATVTATPTATVTATPTATSTTADGRCLGGFFDGAGRLTASVTQLTLPELQQNCAVISINPFADQYPFVVGVDIYQEPSTAISHLGVSMPAEVLQEGQAGGTLATTGCSEGSGDLSSCYLADADLELYDGDNLAFIANSRDAASGVTMTYSVPKVAAAVGDEWEVDVTATFTSPYGDQRQVTFVVTAIEDGSLLQAMQQANSVQSTYGSSSIDYETAQTGIDHCALTASDVGPEVLSVLQAYQDCYQNPYTCFTDPINSQYTDPSAALLSYPEEDEGPAPLPYVVNDAICGSADAAAGASSLAAPGPGNLGGLVSRIENLKAFDLQKISSLNRTVNLVSAVENQGSRQTCWAFTAESMAETIGLRKSYVNGDMSTAANMDNLISPENIIYSKFARLGTAKNVKETGSYLHAYNGVAAALNVPESATLASISSPGLASQAAVGGWPYQSSTFNPPPIDLQDGSELPSWITTGSTRPVERPDVADQLAVLANGYSMYMKLETFAEIQLAARSSDAWHQDQPYRKGVVFVPTGNLTRPAGGPGSHAVQVVGIVTINNEDPNFRAFLGGGFYILKNSWGATSGRSGYLYLPFSYCEKAGTSCGFYSGFGSSLSSGNGSFNLILLPGLNLGS